MHNFVKDHFNNSASLTTLLLFFTISTLVSQRVLTSFTSSLSSIAISSDNCGQNLQTNKIIVRNKSVGKTY